MCTSQQECGRGKPSWICPEPSSGDRNVSPAGAVTFRMDRPAFANVFPFFPLGAWLPLLFLTVPEMTTVVPAWSESRGKWPSHRQRGTAKPTSIYFKVIFTPRIFTRRIKKVGSGQMYLSVLYLMPRHPGIFKRDITSLVSFLS